MSDNKPQFIIGGRQKGKTISLIKEASKTNGIIVCPTLKMGEHVFRTSRELGYDIPKPISRAELLAYPYRAEKRNLYFDEYGMILVWMLQRQLGEFGRYNAQSVIIDKESVDRLNDILGGLNVRDMSGRGLQFKIEILGRNEDHD